MDAPLKDTINCGGCEEPISELIANFTIIWGCTHFRIIKFQTISITNFRRNNLFRRQLDRGREREKESGRQTYGQEAGELRREATG